MNEVEVPADGVQQKRRSKPAKKAEITEKSDRVLDKRLTDLYRFFDARGDLIYVGISGHGVRRMFQHRDRQPWYDEIATIQIEKFKTRSAAHKEEKRLIHLCSPRHNYAHTDIRHKLRARILKRFGSFEAWKAHHGG
jgi:hypothetical protein